MTMKPKHSHRGNSRGMIEGFGWHERQREANFLDPKYKLETTFREDFENSLNMTTQKQMDKTEWPSSVPIPELPKGYHWVCLQPTLTEPIRWWVRLKWDMKLGKQRMLPTDQQYFLTPDAAVIAALEKIYWHQNMRAEKDAE